MSGELYCTVKYGPDGDEKIGYFSLLTTVPISMEKTSASNLSRELYQSTHWRDYIWLVTESKTLFTKGFELRERDGSVTLFMQNYEYTGRRGIKGKRGIYYVCTTDDALRQDQSQKEKSSEHNAYVKKAEDYNSEPKNHLRFAECRPQKIEQLRDRGLLYTHAKARVVFSGFMKGAYPGVPFSFVDLEPPPPPPPPPPAPVAPAAAKADVVRPYERKSQRKLLSYELSIKVLAEHKLLAKIEREKKPVDPMEQSVINSFCARKRRFQAKLDAGEITQTHFDREMEESTAWRNRQILGVRDAQKRFEQYLAERKPLLSPEALKVVAKYNSGGFYGILRKRYTPWLWIIDQRVAAEIRRREEEDDSEMVIKTLVSNAINKKIAEKARLLEEEKKMYDDFFESASSAVSEAAAVSNVDGDAEEEDETDEDEDEDEQERRVRLHARDEATFFFEMELDKAVLHRENKERIEASNKMRCTEEEIMRDALKVDEDTQFMRRAPKRRREPPTEQL